MNDLVEEEVLAAMLESLGKVVLTVGVTVNVVVQATCAPVGKRRMRRICRAEIVDASSIERSEVHILFLLYTGTLYILFTYISILKDEILC